MAGQLEARVKRAATDLGIRDRVEVFEVLDGVLVSGPSLPARDGKRLLHRLGAPSVSREVVEVSGLNDGWPFHHRCPHWTGPIGEELVTVITRPLHIPDRGTR